MASDGILNRTQAVYSASIVYVTSDDDPRRMAYSTKRVYRGVRTTPPGKRDTGRKGGYTNDSGGDVPHETTETRSPKSPRDMLPCWSILWINWNVLQFKIYSHPVLLQFGYNTRKSLWMTLLTGYRLYLIIYFTRSPPSGSGCRPSRMLFPLHVVFL